MRHRVPLVRANGRFVVVDGVEDVAVLEEQVTEVCKCRRAASVVLEGQSESSDRFVAPPLRDVDDARFVERRGSLNRIAGLGYS